jgi:hypothetical protein
VHFDITLAILTNAYRLDTGLTLGFVAKENFPLPTLSPKLREFTQELYSGRGFFVLRTIPIDAYSREDLAIIYAGKSRTSKPAIPHLLKRVHLLKVSQPTSVQRAANKMELALLSHISKTSQSPMLVRKAASAIQLTLPTSKSSTPMSGILSP